MGWHRHGGHRNVGPDRAVETRRGMYVTTLDELADELLDALFDAYPAIATLYGFAGPRDRLLTDFRESGERAMGERIGRASCRERV